MRKRKWRFVQSASKELKNTAQLESLEILRLFNKMARAERDKTLIGLGAQDTIIHVNGHILAINSAVTISETQELI